MPVRNVRAAVVDIGRDFPSDRDHFFVDTNCWYHLTYTKIKDPKPLYPDYIARRQMERATTITEKLPAGYFEERVWRFGA